MTSKLSSKKDSGGGEPHSISGKPDEPALADSSKNSGSSKTAVPLIRKTRSRLAKLLGLRSEVSSLEEEVAELIEEHDPEGTQVGSEERSILHNVLGLSDTSASDIMVPRTDIIAVDYEANLDELKNLIIEKEHTRIPVYKENLDNIVGFVHTKDLIAYLGGAGRKKIFSIQGVVREILFIPPSMKVIDLLLKMKSSRLHMAVVLDEYGGTEGLVTLEDVVEEIIGEIEDEHDEDHVSEIKNIDESSFEVNARMPVEELEEKLGEKLKIGDESEDFDTLGGLVFSLLGHIPVKGEIAKHESGVEFEVIEADARKVSRLLVRKAATK